MSHTSSLIYHLIPRVKKKTNIDANRVELPVFILPGIKAAYAPFYSALLLINRIAIHPP